MMFNFISKRNYSLSFQIASIVAIGSMLLGGFILYFSFINAKQNAIKSAVDNTQALAATSAGKVKADVEVALDVARNLAHTFESFALANKQARIDSINQPFNREDISNILQHILERQKYFLGTYTLWEPNAFDAKDQEYVNKFKDNDETGRFIPYWFRRGDEINVEPLLSYTQAGTGDYYQVPKRTKNEAIINPYLYPISGKEVLIISTVAPIMDSLGTFLGIAGVDIQIDWIQNYIDDQTFFEGQGQMSIIAADGTLAGVQGQAILNGKPYNTLFGELDQKLLNLEGTIHFTKQDTLYAAVPVFFGNSNQSWTVVMQVPLDKILENSMNQLWLSILIEGIALVIFIFLLVWLINKMLAPLKRIAQSAKLLADGHLNYRSEVSSITEINQLNRSFTGMIEAQREVTDVCQSVAEGDLSKTANVKSDSDALASAVNKMTEHLRKASQEETKQHRFNNCMQQLSSALHMDESLEIICDRFLNQLCRTLELQQAYLYIAQKNDKLELQEIKGLTLTAAYAFDRKKFIKQQLQPGEGLTGQCFLEGAPIYLERIPEDFSYISSALGQSNPRAIYITPLIYNEETHGVLEICSFNHLNETSKKVLEKISEQLASVIFLMKSRQHTEDLLKQSVVQTEKMQAQEEELRQSVEEMATTQEGMRRKEQENRARNQEALLILDTVNKTPALIARCRNDESYSMLFISQYATELTGYTVAEIKQKGFAALIHPEDLEGVTQSVDEQLQDKSSYEVSYRLVKKNGGSVSIWEYGHENHFEGEQFLDFFIVKLEGHAINQVNSLQSLGK